MLILKIGLKSAKKNKASLILNLIDNTFTRAIVFDVFYYHNFYPKIESDISRY